MRHLLAATGALVVSLMAIGAAEARTEWLRGATADHFIALHFPNAAIPGPINAAFAYTLHHRRRYGWASCEVPAMGARSDGAVSTCFVRF